ncbi:hypothetical protein RvY_12583 [Ramazzottius varieornatus]|uniref:G-protein coupled receptors family 1 profile domain-containing protein n=1 Tax=Ramazzottius varieornatus TaxID=947166 RepID=A0A1D1VQG4_RAMVA|nr:hypothetical protein RvY_12583 [Ramazzottius varieornatus]
MRIVNSTLDSMNSSSFLNLTSLFNCSWLRQMILWSAYQWRLAVCYPLNLLLALSIGAFNFLCLLTICTRQSLRSGTAILIAHMMLVQATMGLLAIPIHITFWMVHLKSHLTCQIYQFFFTLLNIALYFNIVILAVNRLMAIPLHYRRLSQPKWIAAFIAFIWVSSFIINLPMEFGGGTGHYGVDQVWGACTAALIRAGQLDYRMVQISLGIYVPLSVSGFLYVAIMYGGW